MFLSKLKSRSGLVTALSDELVEPAEDDEAVDELLELL